MVGGYDLGGYATAPLGTAWLVRQRLSDEGKGRSLGLGFLDCPVGQCQPLPGRTR
jgi:hypothetical protein